ncbi:MAG: N-acetyltransferase [Rhodospirillales bacterium]|nr:N-acetyltransferase [Rhodospirillales bacterium]
MVTVRDAVNADAGAVRRLVSDAFGQPAEADLVEALKRSGAAVVDLVAELDSEIVGHVLLSKLQAPSRCVALAPISVAPKHQKSGVGSALMDQAVRRAKADGWAAIFVLGDPGYYTRFGFDVAAASKFETEYPKAYFMALEIEDGALEKEHGQMIYAQPFLELK